MLGNPHLAVGALEKYWPVSYSELDKHQLASCCADATGALCRHATWEKNRKQQLPCKSLLWVLHTADASFTLIYSLNAVEAKCLLPGLLAYAGEEVGPLWPRQGFGL